MDVAQARVARGYLGGRFWFESGIGAHLLNQKQKVFL